MLATMLFIENVLLCSKLSCFIQSDAQCYGWQTSRYLPKFYIDIKLYCQVTDTKHCKQFAWSHICNHADQERNM